MVTVFKIPGAANVTTVGDVLKPLAKKKVQSHFMVFVKEANVEAVLKAVSGYY